MTKTAELGEEIAIGDLDQRYGSLRLASPPEMTRLRSSIERLGILNPVLVATAVEADRLVLVDGFKRVRIATDRGDASIRARRAPLDATAAKVTLVAANAATGGLCNLEEAWVVRSLHREHKLTQVDVGRALRRDKSWVCRRLALAERLHEELQEQIRLGLLSSTVARELARLPRGNQLKMADAIRAHELSSKQAHRIVTALLGADDPRARDEVLANPLRYLGASAPANARTNDPRLGAGGNELRRALLLVDGAAEKLARTVARHAPAGLVGDEARILAPLVERAGRAGRDTTALVERLT